MARAKILVVEDEQRELNLLLDSLTEAGYEIVVARDGVQALELFERERPDLVTLDLGVPEVSGFRLIQVFKQGANRGEGHVPVIVVTGMDFEEAEEVAFSGADDFISKPFDPVLLLSKVQAALAKAKQSRA